MVETKDITEIELTYNCWMSFKIDELENVELFKTGKVVRFWVKYCTLHMELQDGTVVEEDVSNDLNEDTKWPTQTMIEIDGEWEEYNGL
jgi:hypothetical protein|tara:strand:- start:1065 stop:1331 length:267 start_codon:yes stop_codon:yes gene_type:complete